MSVAESDPFFSHGDSMLYPSGWMAADVFQPDAGILWMLVTMNDFFHECL